MIGYVILVTIAIAMAVLVFAYLQYFLPSEKPKCYDDISLSIENLVCQSEDDGATYNVRLKLKNRGLFSIDGAFVRIGSEGRVYKQTINNYMEDESFQNEQFTPEIIFIPDGGELAPNALSVEKRFFDVPNIVSGQEYIVEVEPLVFIDEVPALCDNAIAQQKITCDIVSADSDGDGVSDALDNCPNDANGGQEDFDDDGLGDVCDPDADGDTYDSDLDGGDDCDDLDPNVNPGQTENCNDGFDNDCDGDIDSQDSECPNFGG
jgi:hypothetical protein